MKIRIFSVLFGINRRFDLYPQKRCFIEVFMMRHEQVLTILQKKPFKMFIFRYAPEGRLLILSTEASCGKKCSENFDGISGSI